MPLQKYSLSPGYARFIPVLYLFAFYLLPIFIWILRQHGALSFESILHPPFIPEYRRTLVISTLTSVASIIFAYPIAFYWWMARNRKLAAGIMVLLFVPVILGLLTRNYAWMSLLSHTGFDYSFGAVVLVMVYIFIPFSFFILVQGFAHLSPNILEAAQVMGASMGESFRKIILPLTARHLFIAFCLAFTNSLCYYITPEMIGGNKNNMIGNIIWQYVDHGYFAEASAVSLILLSYMTVLFVLVISFIYQYRKHHYHRKP